MSAHKTGLMFSPLSSRIFYGRMNTKTGVSIGNPKDVTSDFIGIMLQKFPINTQQIITANGRAECVIMVLDQKEAAVCSAAPKMLAALKAFREEVKDNRHSELSGVDPYNISIDVLNQIDVAIAEAEGSYL